MPPVGCGALYAMGLAAFGWTPCIGPILAAILSIAAAEATVAKGAGLLAVYSAGLGILLLLAALMIEQFSSLFARMKRHLSKVEHAMGILMVITGILSDHLPSTSASGCWRLSRTAKFRLGPVTSGRPLRNLLSGPSRPRLFCAPRR